MKTLKSIIVITMCFSSVCLNAQIKIVSNGNVRIGDDNTPLEKLHLNGSIRGNQNGALRINTGYGYMDVGPTNVDFAHFSTGNQRFYFNKIILLSDGKISSYSTNNLQLCTGHNSAITRITISASNGNVGIGLDPISNAKLNVAGSIAINGVIKVSSDIKLKENVKTMDESFNKIALLQPITFNYKKGIVKPPPSASSDSIKDDLIQQQLDDEISNHIRYGFSAQDLQKIYPDLVTQNSDGYLSIDYLGLIPVLVEAYKELDQKHENEKNNLENLQNKLTEIERRLENCCSKSEFKSTQTSPDIITDPMAVSALYQNSPNPFNEVTTIAYYLPRSITSAKLYIYNLQGLQIKGFLINERENGKIVINGNELKPGIYLYSLIADGKEVDTKRMILTE